jgi:hypothetical protein
VRVPCLATAAAELHVTNAKLQLHLLAVRHAANASHKGRKGAHDGHEASQHNGLAAVFAIEGLGLRNVFLLQQLLVKRPAACVVVLAQTKQQVKTDQLHLQQQPGAQRGW